MAYVRVDTDAMRSVQASLSEDVSSIASSFQDMVDDIAGLDATWEGANHDAFKRAYSASAISLKARGMAFETLVGTFGDAVRGYQQCEEQVDEVAQTL